MSLWASWGATGLAQATLFTPATAVQYARAHNPSLAAMRLRARGADGAVRLARAQGGLRVTLGDQYALSDDPLAGLTQKLETRSATTADFAPALLNHPGTTHLNTLGLTATLPLYLGGARRDQVQAARYARTAAEHRLARSRQQIAAQVLTAYATVAWARASVRIEEQAVALSARHVQTTTRLRREGQIVASDRWTAEVAAAQARMQRRQARAAWRTAQAQFRLLLGLPADTRLQLAPMPAPAVPRSVRPLIRAALRQRPDLAALAASAQAARMRGETARASRKPRIALTAANDWYDNYPGFANHSFTVMATVQGTLYDGGAAHARERTALDRARALDRTRAALAADVAEQVTEAVHTLRLARRQFESAERVVRTAAHAADLVRTRYGEGRTPLFDVLQSEHTLIQARMTAAQASYDWRRAGIALAAAEGLDPQ